MQRATRCAIYFPGTYSMFTSRTIRRLFRRNTEARRAYRGKNRWGRSYLLLTPLEDRSVPAVIKVTSNLDTSVAGDGSVTLREAIAAISAGTTSDADILGQSPGSFGVNDS